MVHFPGQDGGPRGDNYYDCVIRDFKIGHPLTDSKIRIWVLPVEDKSACWRFFRSIGRATHVVTDVGP